MIDQLNDGCAWDWQGYKDRRDSREGDLASALVMFLVRLP